MPHPADLPGGGGAAGAAGHPVGRRAGRGDPARRAREGWVIAPVEPGELEGRIQVRGKHWAVVRIQYDRVALSIRYKDSGNLLYDGKRIHRNYNKWVARLAKEITEAVNQDARTGSYGREGDSSN